MVKQAGWVGAALAMVPAVAALADQIVVNGRNFPNAKVLSLTDGRIQFRAADGTVSHAYVEEIDSFLIDRGGAFADINEAERLVSRGDVENALVRYRRAARISEGFWGEFVEARILRSCDRPELIDQAALVFVRVVRGKSTGPTAAARLIPSHLPTQRDAKSTAALDTLDAALFQDPSEAQRIPLELFRFALLHAIGDAKATAAAGQVLEREQPGPPRCDRVSGIVRDALKTSFADGAPTMNFNALDRFIRDCPPNMLADGLLLKGSALLRTAKSNQELVRASWPFLRVAIQLGDDPRAAEALLGAAECLRRLGRGDKARQLLEECRAHRLASREIREKADVALAALEAGRPEN
jgi:tetratricopeptide (TPR) repeat protein